MKLFSLLSCKAIPTCTCSNICATLLWARRAVLALAAADLGVAAWRANHVIYVLRTVAPHHSPILAQSFILMSLGGIAMHSILTIVSAGISTTAMQRTILRLKQLNDDVCTKG